MSGGIYVFMHAERLQESGDNYGAVNPSGHYGAYQFGISTWQQALSLATLAYSKYWYETPNNAPPVIQDAAAHALMTSYYNQFSYSWYNVAEAWYGGPGAVGHPDWGGGPGYPNVGQYASQVMAKYDQLSGEPSSGTGPAPPDVSPFSAVFVSSYADFYTGVIEPMGKTWRQYSQRLAPGFYVLPRTVR